MLEKILGPMSESTTTSDIPEPLNEIIAFAAPIRLREHFGWSGESGLEHIPSTGPMPHLEHAYLILSRTLGYLLNRPTRISLTHGDSTLRP